MQMRQPRIHRWCQRNSTDTTFVVQKPPGYAIRNRNLWQSCCLLQMEKLPAKVLGRDKLHAPDGLSPCSDLWERSDVCNTPGSNRQALLTHVNTIPASEK